MATNDTILTQKEFDRQLIASRPTPSKHISKAQFLKDWRLQKINLMQHCSAGRYLFGLRTWSGLLQLWEEEQATPADKKRDYMLYMENASVEMVESYGMAKKRVRLDRPMKRFQLLCPSTGRVLTTAKVFYSPASNNVLVILDYGDEGVDYYTNYAG